MKFDFGLPVPALNFLCFGLSYYIFCLGFRTLTSPNISLQIANNSLVLSSAEKLTTVANQLESQAQIIREKDKSYQELDKIYQRSLRGKDDYGRLQNAIETVGEFPEIQETDLNSLQTEISVTKEILGEITPE